MYALSKILLQMWRDLLSLAKIKKHLDSREFDKLSGGENWASPVLNTVCLAFLNYDLNNKQYLCRKCPKLVSIQFSLAGFVCRPISSQYSL